jgi:monoamine oxidase
MERRKFIKDAIKSVPALLSLPVLLSSCKSSTAEAEDDNFLAVLPKKTVVVIGAGVAGLAAAKKLKTSGFTVIVLEAQDKIGGRTRTNRTLGVAFDEGASWIHGPTGNRQRKKHRNRLCIGGNAFGCPQK